MCGDTPKQMGGRDWASLMLLSLLWGGGFFFTGVAVREMPPLTVVALRVILAALALLPIFYAFGHRLPRGWRGWRPFFVMGVLNNALPFGFIFAGQTFIGSGLASIVNATTPLFTLIVLYAFREEGLTTTRLTGVALGAGGVAVLKGADGPFGGDESIGVLLCLAGALSYGFAGLWGRRALAGIAPLKSATCQLLCSSVVMIAVAGCVDRPWTLSAPSAHAAMSIAALALIGTAAAYLLFFHILVRAGASNVMLVTLLIPATSLLLGGLFLDEIIEFQHLLGAAIIGAGLLFIDGRAPNWIRKQVLRG
ncbi:MAG: DMT family transporter [Neomegalonema sp.]|nr:DMT family transporter [Neomegalonema sp.]